MLMYICVELECTTFNEAVQNQFSRRAQESPEMLDLLLCTCVFHLYLCLYVHLYLCLHLRVYVNVHLCGAVHNQFSRRAQEPPAADRASLGNVCTYQASQSNSPMIIVPNIRQIFKKYWSNINKYLSNRK